MYLKQKITLTLALLLCLTGCLGSEVKKLGVDNSTSTTSTNTNNSDPFTVNVAYRDPTLSTNRVVQLAGPTDLASANYKNICGADGSACTCSFYLSTSDTNPASSSTVHFSSANNTLSCTISGAVGASSYNYVRIHSLDGSTTSGFININTSLTLQKVLGSTSLTAASVRRIYTYSCARSFLEGEGVTSTAITCVAGQHLGFIYASYNFYLYENSTGTDSNLAAKGGDTPFSTTICDYKASLTQIQCANNPNTLVFGLYPTNSGQFTYPMGLTPSPTASGNALVGYAALPDASGTCPVGLVEIRPYVAQPSSIYQNSLGSNPPSQFINSNNSLNNTVLNLASATPAALSITRAANANPCSSSVQNTNHDYICTGATMAGANTVQSVSYTAETPVLCAIPVSLLQ